MKSVEISAHWTGRTLRFIGVDSRGNEVKMGGRENLSPSQMILLGLAGCMGMDVLSILQKKRQQVSNVEVRVIGHQPEEYPKPYQNVEVAITVKGDNINPKAVERAIELSEEKYCVVGQTLQNQVTISTTYTIDDEE